MTPELIRLATRCCQMPMLGIRCTGCGHRQPVAGVQPPYTRYLALRNPTIVVTELLGRARARRAGKFYTTQNGV